MRGTGKRGDPSPLCGLLAHLLSPCPHILLPPSLLLCRSLAGMLPRLPPSASAALAEALGVVQAGAVESVAPLFKAVMEALEERLTRMHDASGYAAGCMQDNAGGGRGVSGGGGGADGETPSPPPPPPPALASSSMVNTSPYVAECVHLIASFR